MQLFKTPILLIIFNRPEETRKVFEVIKRIQPQRLYIAADGPREAVHNEWKKIEEARDIINKIDWECDLKTLFRKENLGCKLAVSGAIDWFFENEEYGIIIEDDCILDPSFFPYCEELLHRYAEEERVMTIGAENIQPEKRTNNSYYFSKFMHCWGWASWRRAWKHYDVDMKSWPTDKVDDRLLKKIFSERKAIKYWKKIFDNVYNGKVDTWDRQWTYAIWKNKGVNIVPEVNLVSNIGFGENATHTKNRHSKKADMTRKSMEFPVKHPDEVELHKKADYYAQFTHFQEPLYQKVYQKIRGLLSSK